MAEIIYEADAGDLDGSTVTFSQDMTDKVQRRTLLYVNDLDVSITADAKLSHFPDTSLVDAYSPNSQSIAADERGSDTLINDAWERIGAEVSFASNPSSGSLTVYLITRRRK